MKVILLEELRGKGGEGDVVEVTRGFANNYLLPQKIAMRPLRIAWLSGLCTLIVGYLLTRLCAALVRFVREIRLPE